MKYILSILLFFFLSALPLHAQENFDVGTILSIEKHNQTTDVNIFIEKGPHKDTSITIDYPTDEFENLALTYSRDDKVVISSFDKDDKTIYQLHDKYRIQPLIWIFILFLIIAIIFGKKHGARSILGLAFSIFIIISFIVPRLLAGQNPLLICIIGAIIIAAISMFLSHGFNRRTSVALISTIITFTISCILAVIFVSLSKLTGLGSEEAAFLVGDSTRQLNLQGLLLGGIIIGTLGVLDDVTTSQTASIDELYKANSSLTFSELYRRGTSIGKEHIASLINTLALAYAGASLPLFLLFAINKTTPYWVALNSEFIAEEIIRTLVGSITLVLAVPLSTLLATYIILKTKEPLSHEPGHTHVH